MKSIVCCALLLVACPAVSATAGECGDCCNRCDRCGCQCACCKVCRLVPDVKKVPKVEYTCECEDFCVPGPSDHCVVCDECGNKKHVFTPTCGEVRTRVKLVKHEMMIEKPGYKCVVEHLCDACANNCNCQPCQPCNPAPSVPTAQPEYNVEEASYHTPAASPTQTQAATPPASGSGKDLKSQLRRMLQPVLGKQ